MKLTFVMYYVYHRTSSKTATYNIQLKMFSVMFKYKIEGPAIS